MATPLSELDSIHPESRAAWREWLLANHRTSQGVWLILDKKASGRIGLTMREVNEEAVCFGWVDSRAHPIDDLHFKLVMSPRRPESVWSGTNKARAAKMIELGLMTDEGLRLIEIAKRNGNWSVLDDVEALIVPDDLRSALAVNGSASANFERFSPSSKRLILGWIRNAKRPETRRRRIDETVRLAAVNVRANHPKR